ncbi:MAG TPA: peptidoglycan-binding protein, partial [Candidatus Paceibacterota bacterium]|nr:peptidoglycan-binding protein [Candidatus Paceibacterota bacterium]
VLVAVVALAVVAIPAADAAYTRDLTIGSTGSDVAELQAFLVSKGYLVMPAGVSMGYFGSLTQAALASYQAASGIAPAAGYFGPITRAAVMAAAPAAPAASAADDDELSGGDGDFKSFDVKGNPNNEEIEEGQTEEVLAFEFEADDSDLRVERITVLLEAQSGSTSKPWKVLDEISVMVDGDEVASVDASDADNWDEEEDDQYSIDIDDVDAVVEDGEEARVEVAVTAQDNIDSEDMGEWIIELVEDGVRAVNAEGINVYEGGADTEIDGDADERDFELVEVDAGTVDLSFDEDDEGNDDEDVDIDDNDETEEVVLYTFSIEAEDGDITIDEITVTLATTTGTGSDLEDMINELIIDVDGEMFDESVDGEATSSVTFDDIDIDVEEDDEIVVVVSATIEAADDIDDFTEGDGLQVTGVTVDYVDSEDDDQTEDELDDTEGGAMSLRVSGMTVELVSVDSDETFTADEAGEGDVGEYTIKFEVTAGDEDVYVGGVDYSYDDIDDESTSSDFTGPASKLQDSGNYKVSEGSSVTFTLTVEIEAASTTDNTAVAVALDGIDWNTDDSTTTYESYDSNLDDFETDAIFLRGI